MKVLKFGGTSVKDAEMIQRVTQIVQNSDEKQVVVVSAMGGATDLILNAADKAANGDKSFEDDFNALKSRHEEVLLALFGKTVDQNLKDKIEGLFDEMKDLFQGIFLTGDITLKTKDKIVSMGELLSSIILAQNLIHHKVDCEWLDSRGLIKTDSNFSKAKVDLEITNNNIQSNATNKQVYVAPGFISSDNNGNTTTLGRGGSDFTAAIFAAALDADILEIWTDVSGMMTADPRKVPRAYSVESISFSEALELSHFGAKVIYPPTILPVLKKDIPIQIKNTFRPEDYGTKISTDPQRERKILSGISSIDNVSLITLQGSGLKGVRGMASRLFQAVSEVEVNIILITQGSSEHSITFAVLPEDAEKAKQAIENSFELELQLELIDPIEVESNLSVVAAVGENMKSIPGIAATFFEALGRNGVNVKAIAQGASELNISVVIENKDVKKALNAIHEAFFLSGSKTANIFIAGTGTIGKTLLNQIKDQKEYLESNHHIDLRLVGITNSRKMLFKREGININHWEHELDDDGVKADIKAFTQKMIDMNMRNSIFVDNTAHAIVTDQYEEILDASISIVTPNKIANASDMERYTALHDLTGRYGTQFLYETNVGAGLPIINTLKDLIKSGDKILKIEAMLSGSLGFIFSTVDENNSLFDVVKKAHELGYTEPDPRLDLSGMDVARKILILGRESGKKINLSDIQVENCLSKETQEAKDIDSFWKSLESIDNKSFEEKRKLADEKGKRLKYVATLENGSASTSIREVGPEHPFYNVMGTGNIVSFTTQRYKEIPLVVIGPGAGAEVTAAGVFADIIRIANA